MHGSKAPQVKAAAQRRVAKDRVAGEVGRLLAELDIEAQHPLEGLLDAVRRTGAMARMLEHLVVTDLDLKPKVVTSVDEGPRGGVSVAFSTSNDALYGPDHQGDGKPHVVVEMLRVWTELHAKACKLALDADIDQRRVELAQGQAQAVAGVLRGMSDALLELVIGMAGDQRAEIERVWRERWPGIARKQLEAIDLKAS